MLKKYPATIIGACFALLGLFISYLPWLPTLLAMMVIELLPASEGPPYLGIAWLSSLFVLSSLAYGGLLLRGAKQGRDRRKGLFVAYMAAQLFILHPLGSLFWIVNHWFSNAEAQFSSGMTEYFIWSSLAFLFIGIGIDSIWINKNR